jgi:hypothetical protein
MRILLDRPELADLVIADLSRWQDWQVQDRLMTLYGSPEYDVPSIKRAIIRYMLVSTKNDPPKNDTLADASQGNKAPATATASAGASIAATVQNDAAAPVVAEPEHVLKGKKYLEDIKAKDPQTYKEAERFFIVN